MIARYLMFISLLLSLFLRGPLAKAQEMQAQQLAPPPIDGVRCDRMEGAVFHIHQHLAIYAHGKSVPVPAGIGIRPEYRCLYWLHTHTDDGIIHVESPEFHDFTLGTFFDVWGQPLDATTVAGVHVPKAQVRTYAQGRRFEGDPRTILLTLHADIVIEAGPPYFTPKKFTAWKGN